jgi:sortase B
MAGEKKVKNFFRRVLFTTVLLVATAVAGVISLFFILHFMSDSNEYNAARAENDSLRGIAAVTESGSPPESEEYTSVQLSALDMELLQINPDYVCWISIDGTRINHPVVRGADNDTYINTSFYGEPNRLGALFIDFRNRGDSLSNIIIYGHNSIQGEMFGDLHLLLDELFLDENRIIAITVNGRTFEYEIFSVRLTDVYDPAYRIYFSSMQDFNEFAYQIDAPDHATKILTLSTCVDGGSNDARLIVQGYSLSNECIFGSIE